MKQVFFFNFQVDISNHISSNNSAKINGSASAGTNHILPDANHNIAPDSSTKQYSLSSVVCYIDDTQKNIISLVKMHGDEMNGKLPQNGQPQWYVFNDFR